MHRVQKETLYILPTPLFDTSRDLEGLGGGISQCWHLGFSPLSVTSVLADNRTASILTYGLDGDVFLRCLLLKHCMVSWPESTVTLALPMF